MNTKLLTDLFGLTVKNAFITGGASGIGREIALLFAKAGANIVIADLNYDLAQQVVREITGNENKAMALEVNVTDPLSVGKAVEETINNFKQIDILVNSAGITEVPAEELLRKTGRCHRTIFKGHIFGLAILEYHDKQKSEI